MAKKAPVEVQPDLFSMDVKPKESEHLLKIKIPTEEDVNALAKKTCESPRKCYYWILTELNKQPI